MEVKPSGTSLKVLEEVSMDIGLAQASWLQPYFSPQ
jgi:hypothetical protein